MVFGYGLVEVVGLKLGGYYPSSVLSDLILLILQQPNVHNIKFGLVLRQRFDILNRTLPQFLQTVGVAKLHQQPNQLILTCLHVG